MEEYSSADISTRVTLARENEKYRDELLREKAGTALRMIRRIHGEKFSYVRMTDIEKEQEALLAIMDVIRDFDPDKSLNFDGFLKWKIMGRLKAQARFQRKYDDRVTNYGVIIEPAEDESFMPGESRLMSMELPKEFAILKTGGKLVSLRGMPNGEFAVRTGMPAFKRMLLKFAGRKYDQMAAKKNQKYYFIFVHEDGAGLERISEIFAQRHIEASVDEVFALEDVNKALKKVAGGKSKGKTVIRVNK